MPEARRIHDESGGQSASAAEGSDERPLARLAARQHGVVAARQLREAGLSPRQVWVRLRRGQLHELHRGVYAVGHTAVSRHGRWLAAVLAAGPSAVLSHRDALALRALAEYTSAHVEVTLPLLGSRSRPGIRIHRTRRLHELDVEAVDAIPVTSVARTLADVAGSISRRHLREAYIEAERRGLLDVEALARILREHRGKKGLGHLARLAAEDMSRMARTRSPLEARFFEFCADEGIPPPLPNVRAHGYELDAYWPDARLAVELDSYEFHKGRGAFERDRAKIGNLKLAGIDVIPVTDRRLREDRTRLAEIIRAALARATGSTEADRRRDR